MTPERWSRLKDVFGAALELPEAERRDFVERTLASDPSLCEQVQGLLEAEREPLENPVLGALAGTVLPDLARGEMLGPYRVETKIGQGGMGVVYRAWDTRLDRRVALKVLRPEQVGDPVRRQYLVREARAASSLVHPNIVAVYDIGSDRDIDFIAMEHVEGRPLNEVIPPAGLPAKQAVAYGIQIAQALACAHRAGVVHRDLKPGNIMITREGAVKLLDFGLARKTPAGGSPGTVTVRHEIAGTPQYMSPEQIRGEPVDHRSDVFAFGAALYRMLAGRDLFDRGSPMDSIGAILNADAAELCEGGAGDSGRAQAHHSALRGKGAGGPFPVGAGFGIRARSRRRAADSAGAGGRAWRTAPPLWRAARRGCAVPGVGDAVGVLLLGVAPRAAVRGRERLCADHR